MELKDLKKVHLIGDQGVSMQGIAKVLKARGVAVSGCDIITVGHSPEHIINPSAGELDLVLYSSAVTVGSAGATELTAARRSGIMTQKRAWLLGRLMQEKSKIGVAIAGMHGKSTTTAMVGAILVEAGEDPLILGSETRVGSGRYIIVEADEYDRSFLNLQPKIAAVLNIEPEHLDYYTKGLPEIIRAFREFVKLVPQNGVVIINKDDKNVLAAAKSARGKIKYVSDAKPWPGLRLKTWGRHNLFNATMAAHICHELGVNSKTIQKALNNFKGIRRRMEHKGEINGIDVYDDYAHHPTEVKTTLQAAREHFKKRRIIVIFQPHQYSRTKLLFNDFLTAFESADYLLIAPIFAVVGREEDLSVSSDDLAKAITKPKTRSLSEIEIINWLNENTEYNDVVITMGAGPIYKLGEQWISRQNSKKISVTA